MKDEHRERAVRLAIARLWPDRNPADAELTPLTGGLESRSWRVAFGSQQCVLRLPTEAGAPLLDASAEAAAMRVVADAGLAPRVVAADAASGLLVTAFRAAAAPWTPELARTPANVARIAGLLRRLHGVAPDAAMPTYSAAQLAHRYLAPLVADRLLTEGQRSHADELLELARRYDALHAPTVLCHNDLTAANVLDDGELVLVDFEYAVRGAPVLDLAGLAGMNDYGVRERRALLDEYYCDTPLTLSLRELDRVVRMVRLVALFWAMVGARRALDATPYTRLASELTETLR